MSNSSQEQTNWVLPSPSTKFASTLPNYEEALPIRVNREGVRNYLKHQGTLNIGDWATEAKPPPIPLVSQPVNYGQNTRDRLPTQAVRSQEVQHYVRSRSAAPNLSYGQNIYEAPAQGLQSAAVRSYIRNNRAAPAVVYGQNAYEIPSQMSQSDAMQNYTRGFGTTSNLAYGQGAYEVPAQMAQSGAIQNYTRGPSATSDLTYGQSVDEIPAQILGPGGVDDYLRSYSAQPNANYGQNAFEITPQVIGSDAVQNYIKGRITTPNLLYDNLNTPRKHHRMRVKREGIDNYQKNQYSQSKYLMDNYGKLSIPQLPAPNTVGEVNISLNLIHLSEVFLFVESNKYLLYTPTRPCRVSDS